jgi:hypothetical protein
MAPRASRLTLGTILLIATLAVLPSAAELNRGVSGISPESLFPWAEFDPSIPTQERVLGVEPGQRPLRPEEVVAYFRALDVASPLAHLHVYAHTHEGRPLLHLAVSDEATIEGLDAFKKEHLERLDPRGRPASDDAERLADAKAVAYMAYGIHGDELSSPDAAAALAYWLVAGVDDRTRALRENLVILVDPCENPDGRARYLAMITSFAHATANPDQEDLSHRAVWPWGRGNHYLFDLNRDWFNMVHPESERSRVIGSWRPQLMVDSHEMGANSTYLFPPSRHPFNPHLPPTARGWHKRFSADQARALDDRGYPYFSGEWNEEFFPGYGSSWSAYHGAIGILYEMSRTSGTVVRKSDRTVRTFAQAVEHQVTSSVANLTSLSENRAEILRDYVEAARLTIRDGAQGAVRAWVFPRDDADPRRMETFVGLLRKQGIEVLRLSGDDKATGLRDIRTGKSVDRTLPSGSYMVPLDQPAGRMARVLLDPHVAMESGFLSEEREYIETGKGSRLYETTAWSLPLTRGIEAYWSAGRPSGDWVETHLAVDSLPTVEEPFLSVIFDGRSGQSVGALADLLQRRIVVRIAEKPFAIGGHSFSRGAIVVRREGNPDDLADQLQEVARRWLVHPVSVTTARSEDGPDLGGSHFPVLIEPRVGVWTAMPISPTGYGAIWHNLDQKLDLRFNALDIARFGRTDLSRYNVLVFPPSWGGYGRILGESGRKKLERWIEAGGTAIGIGGGAAFLADAKGELTRTRLRSQAVEEFPPVVLGIDALAAEAAGRPNATGLRPPAEGDSDGATAAARRSPYDVAPILGAGAAPFAKGHEQGTPIDTEPVALSEWLAPVLAPGKKAPKKEDLQAADARLRRFMPRGALLRVELDPEFWLSFGLPDEITAWFSARDTLVARAPVRTAARFADVDRLHLGGLLWPEGAGRIALTGYATRERVGRGQVILFADDPVFREWMYETGRLLQNAILYGPGLGTDWSDPW